ncbi:unnamed protein product, partial [Ectocarpus sp. 12 AP-2014]
PVRRSCALARLILAPPVGAPVAVVAGVGAVVVIVIVIAAGRFAASLLLAALVQEAEGGCRKHPGGLHRRRRLRCFPSLFLFALAFLAIAATAARGVFFSRRLT